LLSFSAVLLPSDDAELLAFAGLDHPPPPEEGLFRRGCWLRRVSGEPVLLFGGGRALLLEIAHPMVAAGVVEHSNYRSDPFGRLQRTLEAMTAIVFRDRAAALAAARGVERAHQRVSGRLPEAAGRFAAGTPYSGRDPELMLWVWATLVDTAVLIYQRFVDELSPEARGEYYADHRRVARVLGVPDALVPPDWDEFRIWFDATLAGDSLAVTPAAREIAEQVLAPAASVSDARKLRLITTGLLPPRLRQAFGLAWDEVSAARLEALTASVRGLRRPAAAAP
jgi:uncharacterized protein (DUF2236 family)